MTETRAYRLSKSRFQTGLQCPLALWLYIHEPELADPVSDTLQHIFDTGTSVGELARERFAGGVLVEEDYRHGAEALETTARLMADPPPAIFEAAFQHGEVFVRPDALVSVADGSWDLYEVKSSTKVKPENVTDVAVQTWVLEGAGLRIRRTYLMHLNNTYVYPGGDYDLTQLFTADDVTDEVRAWLPAVPGQVAEMLEMLAGPRPSLEIGKHCDNPNTCFYWGSCHAFLPEYPVTSLPRISADLLDALVADGIFAVVDVPADYPGLTALQREVCELVRSGEARFPGDIRRAFEGLEHPVHFLDFETFQSAVPLYPGTKPWQQVPFQWSDHVLQEDGDLEHHGFVHEGEGDPRPYFAQSLLSALGDSGSIVVYTSFENTRLSELAAALPEHADAIASVQGRLFDLEKVVKQHVRHPECMGRTSIKVVLPALVDDLSYDGLAISEGGAASRQYLTAATGQLDDDQREELFENLRAYCATDTLAMVRLYEELQAAAG